MISSFIITSHFKVKQIVTDSYQEAILIIEFSPTSTKKSQFDLK